MLKVIRSLLLRIVDDIDAGNSNITEGEALEIVDSLKRFTDKEKRLSKYAACEYLNVSRATFDNYVREGKLPRVIVGFLIILFGYWFSNIMLI